MVDNLSISKNAKESNKLWKVQPILDAVRQKCVTFSKAAKLSIDEQMIPFSGTTSLRQYVKNKPNPVGLKNFVLASPSGLVHDFLSIKGLKLGPMVHQTKILELAVQLSKDLLQIFLLVTLFTVIAILLLLTYLIIYEETAF